MKLQCAMTLHNEDEVILKKTNEVFQVVDVKTITENSKTRVEVLLPDGNWYSHKEIL